jgi:hypothetical protein
MAKIKLFNGEEIELNGEYKIEGRNVYDTDSEGNKRLRLGGINGKFELIE